MPFLPVDGALLVYYLDWIRLKTARAKIPTFCYFISKVGQSYDRNRIVCGISHDGSCMYVSREVPPPACSACAYHAGSSFQNWPAFGCKLKDTRPRVYNKLKLHHIAIITINR